MGGFRILGACVVVAAACGGGNNSTPDSRSSDVPTPDAPGTEGTRVYGTLAVTSVNLTDPATAGLSVGGAAISLEFDNLTKNDGGTVVFGTGAMGECTVVQYDAGSGAVHKPHPPVDEGTITLSGAGFKQPVATCQFSSGQYTCPIDQEPAAAGTYSASNASSNAFITVTNHSYTTAQIGSWVNLTGFADTGMNGIWPIVDVSGGLATLNIPPGQVQNASSAAFSAVDLVQLQGVGPVPGGQATVDFIDTGSGSDHVEIALAGNPAYPTPIDSMLSPIGLGMVLDGAGTGCTDCAKPHQFPTGAGNPTVSFSCDPTIGSKSGNCGDPGDQLSGGMLVYGSTTDASVNGLPVYAMPSPVSSYATFSCKFPMANTVQIPNGAIAAILGTSPTRIETRVVRATFGSGTDSVTQNTWATVAGHGLVGHTDVQ